MRTIAGMFVRKRRNRSGTTSVVVVDKSSGRFKELTTIGVASTSEEIAALEAKAQRWIDHYGGQQAFDFEESAKAMEEIHRTISMIERTLTKDKVYKELERTLRVMGIGMSVDKVLFIAKTITTLKIRLPNGELYTWTLYNTPQQEALKPLIEGVAHARE